MDEYPLPRDLGQRQTLFCQWEDCTAGPFANYECLARHLKRTHSVPHAELAATWVYEWSNMERRTMTLTDDEINHVRVVYGADGEAVEDSFTCIPCSKTMKKTQCLKHMKNAHGDTLDVAKLKVWATVKDGNRFHNKTADSHRSRLLLTWAMETQAGMPEGDGEYECRKGCEEWGGHDHTEQQGDDWWNEGDGSAGSAEWAMAAARAKAAPSRPSGVECDGASDVEDRGVLAAIVRQLAGLKDVIQKATAPKQLEFETVTVEIADISFSHAEEKPERATCPRELGKGVKGVIYDKFEDYLCKTRNQVADTRKKYHLAITRLLNLAYVPLEPGDRVDYKAYLVTLYKDGVLQQVMDLPIMDLRPSVLQTTGPQTARPPSHRPHQPAATKQSPHHAPGGQAVGQRSVCPWVLVQSALGPPGPVALWLSVIAPSPTAPAPRLSGTQVRLVSRHRVRPGPLRRVRHRRYYQAGAGQGQVVPRAAAGRGRIPLETKGVRRKEVGQR